MQARPLEASADPFDEPSRSAGDASSLPVLATLRRLEQEYAEVLETRDLPAGPAVAETDEPIFVTRPFLPPLEEFTPLLARIWQTRVLTNGGPYHRELERRLRDHLGVPQIALFNNATTALIVALRALHLSGEVITTPYSFVATSHALLWSGLTPVFADVDPHTLNLDPAAIEAAITPRTSAILPVHCYGHPCDVEAIEAIARRHGLKVIYDAAHAFGVRHHGRSLLTYGDLSVLSFHATKVFNTFEGGAIVCADGARKDQIDKLKNFGHDGETCVGDVGLNGKMSELNAALGLVQLDHIDAALARRRAIDAAYREGLRGVPGLRCLDDCSEDAANYAYFPVLIEADYPLSRDALNEALKREGIHPRRYFYPLISEFPMYRSLPSARRELLPVAAAAADRVLCLPIYPDLDHAVVSRIIRRIANP
ncbi:DegT/DnrJ/EryC1/StrS family aminotransferase [Methylobacterium planeticum]|uniref:DegT/DnrJ/EryC1/StrS family aminotransferase n=1 Tax=Methylobacterium planeticum TaxID=2615211 RepID=A0A6N6MZM7_9HYPH|nr:DegT/DnrJ/EryC1/StrS family aminotransferase [Methylobacterium planeticum]KAB1076074.1 DegT/DnrJ/EryC1/StrS family aminotransferase [Methylobacterium planeticum]